MLRQKRRHRFPGRPSGAPRIRLFWLSTRHPIRDRPKRIDEADENLSQAVTTRSCVPFARRSRIRLPELQDDNNAPAGPCFLSAAFLCPSPRWSCPGGSGRYPPSPVRPHHRWLGRITHRASTGLQGRALQQCDSHRYPAARDASVGERGLPRGHRRPFRHPPAAGAGPGRRRRPRQQLRRPGPDQLHGARLHQLRVFPQRLPHEPRLSQRAGCRHPGAGRGPAWPGRDPLWPQRSGRHLQRGHQAAAGRAQDHPRQPVHRPRAASRHPGHHRSGGRGRSPGLSPQPDRRRRRQLP